MSQPNDPFNPAMQQFAQLGQAMAQQFFTFLGSQQGQHPLGGAPIQIGTPEPAKLTALQQEFLQQQTLLWNAMLARGKPGNERVILVNEDYRSGHRIDAVVRALQEQRRLVNKTDKHPHTNESEVLFLQAARHQVNKIVRGRDGTPTYVYVSEK